MGKMDRRRIFIIVLLLGDSVNCGGPVFLFEPPAHLVFSNTTGSQVSCSAHGSPTPQVDWLTHDHRTVTSVPGLRQSLGNGTLYFPPFRAEDYRRDVHATIYRCKASNMEGTILSREVNVRAVVNQLYEVQVYNTHVSAGNTAVLGCMIPAFVKEHVSVTSWSRDESILLPGSNMGGRTIVTYGTGDLHIRSARADDAIPEYSCLTLHALTQERKRSAPARLTITEPSATTAPRLAPSVQTVISADKETDVQLTCSAQGNPPPTFAWFRDINGHLQPVHATSRYDPALDILNIKRLKIEDSGRWTCKVSNSLGEQRLDIHLTVTAHLSVHVLPQLQVINSGESAIFNCTVSGTPVGQIQWIHNGEKLNADANGKIKLLSPLVLSVSDVTRYDMGMYQCMARNDRESAQGSAELRLGDIVPELQYRFAEQTLRPGPQISLGCTATGSPPPQFRWFLYGESLPDIKSGHRYAISQYVDQAGDVISHLNITDLRVEDGGLYSCRAENSLGTTQHTARLNIYGSPFIRSIGPIKAVAAEDVTLNCPYSGYPIENIKWERHGQEVLLDFKHSFEEGDSLTISRLDPKTDSGSYGCSVTNREGELARREIQLIIYSPPIIEPFSFSTNLQEGKRAQVTCAVTSGDLPIHFGWHKNGESIPALLQVEERAAEFYSMLIFKEVSARHSGSYTCVASNSAARANFTAQLMVKVAPQWVTEPQDASTLLGNQLLVECSAKGYPQPQITWSKGQGKLTADYQSLLTLHSRVILMANGSMWLENAVPQDEGHYLCQATNGIGSGLAKVIYIDVNEPARFDLPTENISTKRGSSVVLLCKVYGDVPIEIVWTSNGNRLDLNNYRFSISIANFENGVKSEIAISRADRSDSGHYKCLAENAFGHSEHIINLAVQERPEPPSMLQVVEVSSRTVRLAWEKPFDGNSAIIGYLVQYQVLGAKQGDWKQPHVMNLTLPASVHPEQIFSIDPPSRQESVVSNLQPATVYTIRMLAVNSIDESPFTEAIVVKTQEEEPSESPKDVRVEAVGPGELFLTWSAPPRHSWNGELLGYVVTWHENEGFTNNTRSTTVKGWATNKLQLTGLKKFTRYGITMRAFNSVSVGPPSLSIIGTTKEGVPEAPPQKVACSEITSQIMKISWYPPPTVSHGGHILGYKVHYRPLYSDIAQFPVDMPTTGEVKRTTSSETYLHGLYKYTNYSIKVLAYTGAGDGVKSEPLVCTTEEDSVDPSLAGNYTCSAKNLFGEDEITYSLIVLMPPGAPSLDVQFTTSTSIRLHWTHPENGGSPIQGFNLNTKHDTDDWTSIDMSPELSVYTLENLKCGSLYHVYLLAYNRVGNGSPSPIQTLSTKGGPPHLPKEKDLIVTSAITLQLNLYNWPNGGCPISHFSIQYKAYNEKKWILIAKSVSEEMIVVHNLMPAMWYQLKITAENDAGTADGLFNFATTTLTGGHVPMPTILQEDDDLFQNFFIYTEAYIIIPVIFTISLCIFIVVFWILVYKNKKRATTEETTEEVDETEDRHQHRHHHRAKTTERDNRRNCQQVYTSSPGRSNVKINNARSGRSHRGAYEISPYATFSLPGPNNSRSVTTSTLDYTVQFKTFGHIEDEERNSDYPINGSGKHAWYKNQYYSNDAQTRQFVRPRQSRLAIRRDSESDTSGSPCGEGPSGSSYTVPVKTPRDLFRPDSSSDSNDVSPLAERRLTPRHVIGRRHPTPTSSRSSEEDQPIEAIPAEEFKLKPPSGFSDTRDMSETECDRDLNDAEQSVEFEDILARYYRDEERREFTIHV